MQAWGTRVVCEGSNFRPRQFEYHPTQEGLLLFGTIRGDVVAVDVREGEVLRSFSEGLSKDRHDSILG